MLNEPPIFRKLSESEILLEVIFNDRLYNLGIHPSEAVARQHFLKFIDDADSYIDFLNRNSDRNGFPKGITYIARNKSNPFMLRMTYQSKPIHVGSYPTMVAAQYAQRDFQDDPDQFMEFIKWDRSRELPPGIYNSPSERKPYRTAITFDHKRYYLGSFVSIEAAQHTIDKFKENPKSFLEKSNEANTE